MSDGFTLREYILGKRRTALWKRYDNAMRCIFEWAEKFEKDEQAGANNAFRHRYRTVLDQVRTVLEETDHARSDSSGDSAARPDVRADDERLAPTDFPFVQGNRIYERRLDGSLANENVGAWDMRLAYRFPNGAGDVVVCIPVELDQEALHKAWYAVAKLAQDPSRVPDIDGEESEGEIPEALGAVEFMRGVNELVKQARAMQAHLDGAPMTAMEVADLRHSFRRAHEPFGDE